MPLFLTLIVLSHFVEISGQGRPYYFNQDEINLILYEHNRYRASEPAANMQELVWDQNLAHTARDWATKCIGDHRPDRNFKAGFAAIGENLWWTSSSYLWKNLRRVIWDFYREKYIYDYNTGFCPPGQLCGHYTQLVWASSCSIGCAAAVCPYFYNGRGIRSGVMVACNYGPAGNYLGQKPYVYGLNCQMCPGSCRNGLCQSKCAGYAMSRSNNISNIVQIETTTAKLQSPSAYTVPHSTTKMASTAATTVRPLTVPVATKGHLYSRVPQTNKDCVNRHPACATFKKLQFCFLQRPYMLRYCRLACDIFCQPMA